jgi:hypothetical protein
MNIRRIAILLISMLLFTCYSRSQSIDNNPVKLVVVGCDDFKVTGDGSSGSWADAQWIELSNFGQQPRPEYKTRAKVLYSATGIYFLFECQDRKLTTTMKADNLNLWEEDVVEVFLWTAEDFPVYFEYEISPLNYELPIMVPNYKGSFLGWLPWNYDGKRVQHETSVTGGKKESGAAVTSWMAEFYIPYKLLAPLPNVPPQPGTKWRANMYRIDYDTTPSVRWMWSRITRNFHDYNNFGIFQFE